LFINILGIEKRQLKLLFFDMSLIKKRNISEFLRVRAEPILARRWAVQDYIQPRQALYDQTTVPKANRFRQLQFIAAHLLCCAAAKISLKARATQGAFVPHSHKVSKNVSA
jgi:hypothetical protein